jgi:hypothetical protein
MTDHIEQARKSGELLGIVGKAALIAIALCCGVVSIGAMVAVLTA